MNENRGPVIYAALVTSSLVLAWLTLFSLERFGATEVRAWAPLLQALLSAGAIYSAWWLQDAKRRADRAEATRDSIVAVAELIRLLEWQVARVISAEIPHPRSNLILKVIAGPIENVLLMLRQQKSALMPNELAVSSFMGATHAAAGALSLLEGHLGMDEDNYLSETLHDQLIMLYVNIRRVRDAFHVAVRVPVPVGRPPADVKALKEWRVNDDARVAAQWNR